MLSTVVENEICSYRFKTLFKLRFLHCVSLFSFYYRYSDIDLFRSSYRRCKAGTIGFFFF